MKTQRFGAQCTRCTSWKFVSATIIPNRIEGSTATISSNPNDGRVTHSKWHTWYHDLGLPIRALDHLRDVRRNGEAMDSPPSAPGKKDIPEDGQFTWTKGDLKDGMIYGVKNERGEYEYELRYDAGPGDLAWFEQKDRSYLTRILRKGKLRECEPAVWYMRGEEHAEEIDIGEWWSQKLKLPNIDALLKKAEEAERQLRKTGAEPPWEKASKEKLEDAKEPSFDIPYKELSVDRELGRGGFGTVYQGKWRGSNVAIKRLHPGLPGDALVEFKREAKIMATLDSQYVIKFLGACVESKNLCIVMEFMPRGSLWDILHSSQTLSWNRRHNITMHMTIGLDYLHRHSIAHRDLKSHNVLVDNDFTAKLCDFGLAKIKSASSTFTVGIQGTLLWMAPELLNNEKFSFSCDMYSYGMVVWEIASREIPYNKQNLNGIPGLYKYVVIDKKRETIPHDCPVKYAELMSQCWKDRPESRPTASQAVELVRSAGANLK